jgi:hypothetical protein
MENYDKTSKMDDGIYKASDDVETTARTSSDEEDVDARTPQFGLMKSGSGSNPSSPIHNYDGDTEKGTGAHSMDDIPIDHSDFGSSLPTSEELRTQAAMEGSPVASSPSRRSRVLCGSPWSKLTSLVAVLSLVFVVVVVISVRISQGQNNNEENDIFGGGTSVLEENAVRLVSMPEITNFLRDSYNIRFTDPDSPQYRAAKWMVEEDPINWPLPGSSNGSSSLDNDVFRYRYLARYIMAVIYYSTGTAAQSGNGWFSQLRFLSRLDICSWQGIVTTPTSRLAVAGVFCNAQNVPFTLNLCKYSSRTKSRMRKGMLVAFNIGHPTNLDPLSLCTYIHAYIHSSLFVFLLTAYRL